MPECALQMNFHLFQRTGEDARRDIREERLLTTHIMDKSSESLEGDHWADRCRDRVQPCSPFNVTSRRSTSRIDFFSNSLQVKWQTVL